MSELSPEKINILHDMSLSKHELEQIVKLVWALPETLLTTILMKRLIVTIKLGLKE